MKNQRVEVFETLSLSEKSDLILEALKNGAPEVVVAALHGIDQVSAESFKPIIKDLAYNHNPDVREAALFVLRFIDTRELTQIINDSLHDENRNVLKIASMLFHQDRVLLEIAGVECKAA